MAQLIAMKKMYGYPSSVQTMGLYYDPRSKSRRFYLQILNANSKNWIDDNFAKQWAADAGTPYEDIKHLFESGT